MEFKNITSYKYSRLHYYSSREALIISKPIDRQFLMKDFPQLKVASFEFSRSNFKKSFDTLGFINDLLADVKLEFLGVESGNGLTRLPEVLSKQPLLYLNLHVNDINDFSDVLPEIITLQELRLFFDKGTLGKNFHRLQNLKKLGLYADSIEDLDQIGRLTNLESLELRVRNMDRLPDNIANLKKLKYLHIEHSTLTEIPSDLHFSELEDLHLFDLQQLKGIDAPLVSSRLKRFKIYNSKVNRFGFPSALTLPALETLELSSIQLTDFPELNSPALKIIRLFAIPVTKVFSKIKDASQVEEIYVNEVPLADDDIGLLSSKKVKKYSGPLVAAGEIMDFTRWPELTECKLNGSGPAIHFKDNPLLKDLEIANNHTLKEVTELPEKIHNLQLTNCKSLERFELVAGSQTLAYLKIHGAPLLSSLQLNGNLFPLFTMLTISKSELLQRLPVQMLAAPALYDIRLSECNPDLMDDQVESVSSMLEYVQKNELPVEEKEVLGYWLFNINRFEKPSPSIRDSSLRLLRYSNDTMLKLISKHFYELNPHQTRLADFMLADLATKKVTITGNTFEAKNVIKDSLKNIQMKVVASAEDADFVLVAKKNELARIDERVILFTETELHNYLDEHQPKFLKQETVTDTHLSNLRQIMWSTNPETELMALEMMKNGGLPDEVLGECIAIAKTSEDKAVRAKYKSFLKGKVSAEAFSLVSKNVRFDPNHSSPFNSLAREFSVELLGKLAMAIYQRTKHFVHDALSFHRADFDLRSEMVAGYMVQQVNEKPHYISIYTYLTNEEWGTLLSLPQVKGQLKRLHMRIDGPELFAELGEHITLKELIINGNLSSKTIPSVIFTLKRVSVLTIHSDTLEELGDGIGEMKELQDITVYNKIPVRLPESLKKLTKLKRVYFSGGTTDGKDWKEFLSSL